MISAYDLFTRVFYNIASFADIYFRELFTSKKNQNVGRSE